MDHYAREDPIYSRIRCYSRFRDMLHSLKRYSRSEIAQERMKILGFYKQYCGKATKEAFSADRKVISRWRKKLKEGNGQLMALVPESTRPHRVRCSEIFLEIIVFIRDLRQKHPRLGKEKIKPLLDKYCKQKNIKTISEPSVGNIIKRHKLFFQMSGRISRLQMGTKHSKKDEKA